MAKPGTPYLAIAPGLALDSRLIEESFVRASGPGGQNVNKVSTAVQIRLDLGQAGLPAAVAARARALGGQRVSNDGVLVIVAQRFRSQDRNRQDATDRLVALLRAAAVPPVQRRPTRASFGQRQDRLADKAKRSALKRQRTSPPD